MCTVNIDRVRYLYYLFCLPYHTTNITPHYIAELDIQSLTRNTNNIDVLISLDILLIDEFYKLSYQSIVLPNKLLQQISNTNIYLCDPIIIFMMNHIQIKYFIAHPF